MWRNEVPICEEAISRRNCRCEICGRVLSTVARTSKGHYTRRWRRDIETEYESDSSCSAPQATNLCRSTCISGAVVNPYSHFLNGTLRSGCFQQRSFPSGSCFPNLISNLFSRMFRRIPASLYFPFKIIGACSSWRLISSVLRSLRNTNKSGVAGKGWKGVWMSRHSATCRKEQCGKLVCVGVRLLREVVRGLL